jgi:hypothetical protein
MSLSGCSPREICNQPEKSRTKTVTLTIDLDICLMSFVSVRYPRKNSDQLEKSWKIADQKKISRKADFLLRPLHPRYGRQVAPSPLRQQPDYVGRGQDHLFTRTASCDQRGWLPLVSSCPSCLCGEFVLERLSHHFLALLPERGRIRRIERVSPRAFATGAEHDIVR